MVIRVVEEQHLPAATVDTHALDGARLVEELERPEAERPVIPTRPKVIIVDVACDPAARVRHGRLEPGPVVAVGGDATETVGP